jgi:hypothetical protein
MKHDIEEKSYPTDVQRLCEVFGAFIPSSRIEEMYASHLEHTVAGVCSEMGMIRAHGDAFHATAIECTNLREMYHKPYKAAVSLKTPE